MGKPDAEDPEEVSVGGLNIGVGLDQGLPLLHHGTELVGGQVHSVEVGEAVLALYVLTDKLKLSETPFGIVLVLKVGKGHLVDAAFQSIGSNP